MVQLTLPVQRQVLLAIEFLHRGKDDLPSPHVVEKELQHVGVTIPLTQIEEVFRRLHAVQAAPLQVSQLLRAVTGELPNARMADYYRETAQRIKQKKPLPPKLAAEMRKKFAVKPVLTPEANWHERIEAFIAHPFEITGGIARFPYYLQMALRPPHSKDPRPVLQLRKALSARPELLLPVKRAFTYRSHHYSILKDVGKAKGRIFDLTRGTHPIPKEERIFQGAIRRARLRHEAERAQRIVDRYKGTRKPRSAQNRPGR